MNIHGMHSAKHRFSRFFCTILYTLFSRRMLMAALPALDAVEEARSGVPKALAGDAPTVLLSPTAAAEEEAGGEGGD
jgi:hypothetical protein